MILNDIVIADTLKLEDFTLGSYSAATYDIWIALRGTDAIDIKDGESGVTITVDGANFDITVTAAVTATWTAGTYNYSIYAGKSSFTERYEVYVGQVDLVVNIAAQVAGYDGRSHVKKTLDAIEAVIENRATQIDLAYSIAGRQITKLNPTELIKFRDYYKSLYTRELRQQRVDNGLDPGNKVKVQF